MEDDLSLILSNALFARRGGGCGPLDPAPGSGADGCQQPAFAGRPEGHSVMSIRTDSFITNYPPACRGIVKKAVAQAVQ